MQIIIEWLIVSAEDLRTVIEKITYHITRLKFIAQGLGWQGQSLVLQGQGQKFIFS